MILKKKDARFGRYPCCDMINNAIRFISDGKYNHAIEELYQAIQKADGYLYEDLSGTVFEAHDEVWKSRYDK